MYRVFTNAYIEVFVLLQGGTVQTQTQWEGVDGVTHQDQELQQM